MIDEHFSFFDFILLFSTYDMPMLQDLDQLANRISRLVSYSERLKTERSELLSRVKLLEQERTTLRDQLSTQQNEYVSMAEVVTRHQQDMENAKRVAEESQETLYAELIQQQDELSRLQKGLERSESKASVLEQAALQAREQIDGLLRRLPDGQSQAAHETYAQD